VDTVGQRLNDAVMLLKEKNISFKVEYTKPARDFFAVDGDNMFVIRQRCEDDFLVLTAAAKMRKEV
jgi:hypothetical protein